MKNRNNFSCEMCGREAERLYQSYVTGKMECHVCAMDDPFMSHEQRTAITRRQQRQQQARENFKQEAA